MGTLSHDEIDRRLGTLNGWTLDGDAIKKQFTFRDFPEAVHFVDRLVPGAEAADHHPDIAHQLQARDADLLDAQRRRPDREGFRRRGRRRSTRLDAAQANLQLARGGGAHRTQRAAAAVVGRGRTAGVRRFRRTGRRPAATPNGATRRSSSSSCWCWPISAAGAFRSTSCRRSSTTSKAAVRRAPVRGDRRRRRRAAADRRRARLRAHGARRLLQPAGDARAAAARGRQRRAVEGVERKGETEEEERRRAKRIGKIFSRSSAGRGMT